jgi:hypothetical protein
MMGCAAAAVIWCHFSIYFDIKHAALAIDHGLHLGVLFKISRFSASDTPGCLYPLLNSHASEKCVYCNHFFAPRHFVPL